MEHTYQKPVKKTDADSMLSMIAPLIENGKTVKLTVTGYSMYPLVTSRRDAVLLAKCETLKIGDVPLFKRPDGSFILHRIIGKKNGAYKLLGDYETKPEYPVYPEQVVAVAKGFYRKDRFISCDSFGYKMYHFVWRLLRPIRPLLLTLLAKLAYLKGKKHKKK